MPEPTAPSSDAELRPLIERALTVNYELDRELGRGGMGIVYRARDRRLKRVVAIKVLPPELAFRGEIRSRFLREAETAAQLSHPNIVPIYSVDERDGVVFFVMACVDGTTLAQRLAGEGRLSVDETRQILREVSDALAYAHGHGVIHRDIKPDNILLDESGRAIVTDFGIARAVQEGGDSRLTATGVAIGTPAYMSPEQAAGDREIDGRSDLYSLGVVGYQMLAGQLPFQATSTPVMLMKHLTEHPTPLAEVRPDVPPYLADSIMTLLEKEPANRFPNAGALEAALGGDASRIPTRSMSPVTGTGRITAPWGPPPTSPIPAAVPYGTVMPYGTGVPSGAGRTTTPTPDEVARWSAPEVQRFRSKFATYAAVNSVIVLISIFSDSGLLSITVVWSIFLAFRYSKLWASGYDWRDVFRQPRDRRFIDVLGESVEYVRAIFDKNRRESLRERSEQRRLAPPPMVATSPVPADYGRYADTVRRAAQDRAELLQMVGTLPSSDRALVEGVIPAADGLYQRVQSLAATVAAQDRVIDPGASERIEREIATLEAQANPLDVAASEERVRRLARLKRERRAVAEEIKRRGEAWAKLESCALALQGMRVDIVRLRAGGVAGAGQQITLLTERARSLADEVDAAVQGAGADRGRG